MESSKVKTGRTGPRGRRVLLMLYLLVFIPHALSTACTGSRQPGETEQRAAKSSEAPSKAATPTPSATATPEPAASTEPSQPATRPKPEEVRDVVARVYGDSVTVDTRRPPQYLVGDFNGDGSEDIAVVVRPVRDKLEEINNEFANWIVEDPREVSLPDPHKNVQKLPQPAGPVKVKASDLLLVVIHGYKKEGWRNPEARQTYCLYEAVGNSMTSEPVKDLLSGQGNRNEATRGGDVIKETLGGEQGFIYWTGAKYAWHKRQ